ncbi:hypothetical protein HYFRA_00002769 [Hymenoscyphus fraxineus]|uniref:YWTD domain-containing protein n=1 Tax=Hymenoscyphus fraxineus TaxID=746836 RepID=A0A9N9KMK8_9HELO|nr:hypothetical protein HYFRA_00002769 [Hymenoscyphus fraxineus]
MGSTTQARLYFIDLDLSSHPHQNGRILTSNTAGTNLTALVSGLKHLPDGIVADPQNSHLYWTNMGASMSNPTDGSIQRCNISDGSDITTIVPEGLLHTPKQLTLVHPLNPGERAKLYWCDREGMRVMRCNLDGSDIETLIQTGFGEGDRKDKRNWCVGIAVHSKSGFMYWSQKGGSKANQGRVLRAPIQFPVGQLPDKRTDIETLLDGLPEPIDLHIDDAGRNLYWMDRGDPPRGNSVNTLDLEAERNGKGEEIYKERILTRKLHEGIGLAVDEEAKMMYFTDLCGGVYSAKLDGTEKKTLFEDVGDCTGIAVVPAY